MIKMSGVEACSLKFWVAGSTDADHKALFYAHIAEGLPSKPRDGTKEFAIRPEFTEEEFKNIKCSDNLKECFMVSLA